MAVTITYSLLDGQQVIDSADGQIIILPCKVTGFDLAGRDLVTGSGDQKALTKIAAYLPALYTHHPDSVNFPDATLRERRIRTTRSVGTALVDLVYRAHGPADWTLEYISQTEYLQTFKTAGGFLDIATWWKSGGDNTLFIAPANVTTRLTTNIQKATGKSILRATGWMTSQQWSGVKKQIKGLLYHTNFTLWGDDPVKDDTGHWLFTNVRTFTNDLNRTKQIECYFLQDVDGHYAIGLHYNLDGEHPPGGVKEIDIRSKGPPPILISDTQADGIKRWYRSQWQMNGITRSAIYPEAEFNLYFNFDPSQA